MVIDLKVDRYLSNSPNNQLKVIKRTNLNDLNYVEKNKNQMNHSLNSNNQIIQYNQFNKMNQSNQLNSPTNQSNQQVTTPTNQHPNESESTMSNQGVQGDKTISNPLQNNNNNLHKDSIQSVNIPILPIQQNKSIDYSDEENDDILEISPCGRWSKRQEQVEQHDIPNLDNSYLCIDGEEGIEVVWNEIRISERKNQQHNESRIHKVFNRLIQLNHNNIVKIHKYWLDKENPRLIFITEYMPGGTLRLFLKKTRSNHIQIKMTLMSWRRWCTHVLCALRYLHGQKPKPIIHGNLNCDTIFISHTGLIKIGCVAPDDIHQNVKTMGANTMANFRLLAPEIINETSTEEEINNGLNSGTVFNKSYSPAVDIYAFGIVALEMAVLGIKNNFHNNIKQNHQTSQHHHRYSEGCINTPSLGYLNELSGGSLVSKETVRTAIDLLDNDLQKDLINKCLNEDPNKRPTAKELLFHPVIFEVPSLKVICANKILNNSSTGYSLEQIDEEFNRKMQNTKSIIGEIHYQDGTNVTRRICDLSKLNTEYLEKFFEEVRQGVYPLYAFQSPFKTKISKFIKIKRNSLKNLVETSVCKENLKKFETLNGSRENLNTPVEDVEDELASLNNGSTNEDQHVTNELNDDENVECQEYEEDYDQEDAGSQNEDYEENRCENCTTDTYEEETRRIEEIEIKIKSTTSGQSFGATETLFGVNLDQKVIVILLKLNDKINRKLSCPLSIASDNGTVLANELVINGFINSKDRELVELKINETMDKHVL